MNRRTFRRARAKISWPLRRHRYHGRGINYKEGISPVSVVRCADRDHETGFPLGALVRLLVYRTLVSCPWRARPEEVQCMFRRSIFVFFLYNI